jgi:putative salt-induced outer membrane protein YdiY
MFQPRLLPLAPLLLLVACASSGGSVAPDPVAEPAFAPPPVQLDVPPKADLPSEIDNSGWEWVRLVSGEWLKGDINVLRDESLEFDSDELGVVTIDWEDVAELYSPRKLNYMLDDRTQVWGSLLYRDDLILIRTTDGDIVRLPSRRLLSIVPGPDPLFGFWSGNVGIGFTARQGNTDQVDFTSSIDIVRRTAGSRLTGEYRGAVSSVQQEETANNHRIFTKWDVFVSRRFYVSPLALELFRDRFQNIDYRVTPSIGAGYTVLDTRKQDWDVELGVGYRGTKFDSVEPGEPETEEVGTGIVGTQYHIDITSDVELSLNYSAQIGFDDVENTNQHAEVRFLIEFLGDFDFDIQFIWDRVGQPVPDAEGNVPKQDDLRLSIGLAWSF